MSRENLSTTLDAVEAALQHLATALDKGGFDAASRRYKQMSEIVVGQRLWAIEQGIDDFDDRFRHVAGLATRVHSMLVPYVDAMDRLRMLTALVPPGRAVEPASDETKVLDAIAAAARPQSLSQLRTAVGVSSSRMRKLVTEMVERRLIDTASAGGRTLYRAAS